MGRKRMAPISSLLTACPTPLSGIMGPGRVMSGARNDMAVGSQFRRQSAEFAVTFTT